MARQFTAASSHYLQSATTPVTSSPLTMAVWFRAADVTTAFALMTVGNLSATSRFQLTANGAAAGDPVQATSVNTGAGAGSSSSGSGYSANVWAHAAAVFSGVSVRTAYLNGVAGPDDTTSITVAGVTGITLGTRYNAGTRGAYFTGRLAYAGLWSIDLGPLRIAALANGAHPLRISPEALVGYWPLFGWSSPEMDVHPRSSHATGYPLTVTGAVEANGPPLVGIPTWRRIGGLFVPDAAPGGGGSVIGASTISQSVIGQSVLAGAA